MKFLRLLTKQSNYAKSNSVTTVKIKPTQQTKNLAKQILKNNPNRQELATQILDELSDLAKINIVNVKISEAKQYHKKYNNKVVSKMYGYYKPKTSYIYINNRTAVRGQILAPKTFLDTLLHEWLHHYDYNKLKLNSIHTSGFYTRLKDLKTKIGYFNT